MITQESLWVGVGFLGQGIFFLRWVVQWLASEKHAASHVPIAFWYLSLIGGFVVLAYAIYRKDPVFIVGQVIGALIYLRNIVLINRKANPPL